MFEPLWADLAQLPVQTWLVMLACVVLICCYAVACAKGERDED